MRFQTELVAATLIRRYKRFLADCRLQDGREVTAHCPNPGSMMGLAEPGTRIWLEPNDDPRKKLKFGWRLVETAKGAMICIDTALANKVVQEALEAREILGVTFDTLRAEVPYAQGSRVDFLLSGPSGDTYVEVKSVTLSRAPGRAEFPDSVTARGAKHLGNLAEMVRAGHRAILIYLVQRDDTDRFALASDIDPVYARAHKNAANAGVETMFLFSSVTTSAIKIDRARSASHTT